MTRELSRSFTPWTLPGPGPLSLHYLNVRRHESTSLKSPFPPLHSDFRVTRGKWFLLELRIFGVVERVLIGVGVHLMIQDDGNLLTYDWGRREYSVGTQGSMCVRGG